MAPHVSETFRKQSPARPLYLTLVSKMDPVKELYAPRPSHRPVFYWLKYVNGGKRPGRGSLIKNRSLRPYLVVSAPPTGVLNIQSETPPPSSTYVDTDIIHMMKWARQRRINVCLQTLDLAIPGLPKIHDTYTACGNYFHYSKLGTSCCPYVLWLAHNTYGFCRTNIHWQFGLFIYSW